MAVVVLIGGFLVVSTVGKNADKEQSASEPIDDTDSRDRAEPDTDVDAEASSLGFDAAFLEQEWLPGESGGLAAGEVTGGCWPAGWGIGVTSRYQSDFVYDNPNADHNGLATVKLAAYDTEGHAAEDLDRALSDEWQACDLAAMQANAQPGSEVVVQRLPPDPLAPGVGYSETVDGFQSGVFVVAVGKQMATIRFCACTELAFASKQVIAQRVADIIAKVQGVPAAVPVHEA